MTRPVTPAEAREMLDAMGREDCAGVESVAAFLGAGMRVRDSARALAETVASEPERIAAARNALRVEVAAALAAWREADAKLYLLLTAGVSNDARRPAATEHRARLDALNELLAPETT